MILCVRVCMSTDSEPFTSKVLGESVISGCDRAGTPAWACFLESQSAQTHKNETADRQNPHAFQCMGSRLVSAKCLTAPAESALDVAAVACT